MSKKSNGKQAEHMVQQCLKLMQAHIPLLDWERIYDSTSARNIMMSQVGDFGLYTPNFHGVIEVKSSKQTGAGFYKGAFSVAQLSRLRKRRQAGGKVWVLLWRYEEGLWYLINFKDLEKCFLDEGKPSFLLSQSVAASEDVKALMMLLMQESLKG